MKKIVSLIIFILILLTSIIKVSDAAPRPDDVCLTITGKFTATNWVGGKIQVGCDGDNGRLCKGQIAKDIRPNDNFTLTKCSCPFNNRTEEERNYADGCLKVAKELVIRNDGPKGRPRVHAVKEFPSQCSLPSSKFEFDKNEPKKLYSSLKCGRNGQDIEVNIKATCPGPIVTVTDTNTPTPTTQVVTSTNTPTPTTVVSTSTPTPTTAACPVPAKVTNVKIKCPNCLQTTPTPGGNL